MTGPVFCSNCYNVVRERQEAAELAAQQRLASLVSATASTEAAKPAPEVEEERAANTVVPCRE